MAVEPLYDVHTNTLFVPLGLLQVRVASVLGCSALQPRLSCLAAMTLQ